MRHDLPRSSSLPAIGPGVTAGMLMLIRRWLRSGWLTVSFPLSPGVSLSAAWRDGVTARRVWCDEGHLAPGPCRVVLLFPVIPGPPFFWVFLEAVVRGCRAVGCARPQGVLCPVSVQPLLWHRVVFPCGPVWFVRAVGGGPGDGVGCGSSCGACDGSRRHIGGVSGVVVVNAVGFSDLLARVAGCRCGGERVGSSRYEY
jgi:hypothetical protein